MPKKAALSRLASIGATLPGSKTTAAGVPVKKGPGGRPRKYAEGEKTRISLVLSTEDRTTLERFTYWLSARDGKRYALADAVLRGLEDAPLFLEYQRKK